jgi:hypothetical protein
MNRFEETLLLGSGSTLQDLDLHQRHGIRSFDFASLNSKELSDYVRNGSSLTSAEKLGACQE